MIRVVVAEDSATARALLMAILNSDPDIEVVGEARDGVEAVELTQRLRPDVVTMDVRMPRLDGFRATKEIMITAPTPVVIVTASIRTRDVEVAMHALSVGAVAVLHKPHGPGAAAFDEAAQKLIATVKAMAQVRVVRHWRPPTPAEPKVVAPRARLRSRLIAIAASTGGPAALQRILAGLPSDCAAPILVVQHITTGFTAGLVDWLNTVCTLRVKIAEQDELLTPGTVYVAPDSRHLGAAPGRIVLSDEPPVGVFRPSATVLFNSVARAFGAAAIAVILTGMGNDGVEGLHSVRQAGGRILAQDEKSCVVFGMPGAAIAAGLADQVVSLEAIPARLLELIG